MKDINNSLQLWLEEITKYELTAYENMPDIDLYMDQMITYLERILQPFALSTLDKQITSSMINNYVKGDCIPSPVSKRYNKEHIAQILEICLLKRANNISDIKQILQASYTEDKIGETYNEFRTKAMTILHEISQNTATMLTEIPTNDQNALLNLALTLSLNANFNILIANRIFDYIRIYNDLNKE